MPEPRHPGVDPPGAARPVGGVPEPVVGADCHRRPRAGPCQKVAEPLVQVDPGRPPGAGEGGEVGVGHLGESRRRGVGEQVPRRVGEVDVDQRDLRPEPVEDEGEGPAQRLRRLPRPGQLGEALGTPGRRLAGDEAGADGARRLRVRRPERVERRRQVRREGEAGGGASRRGADLVGQQAVGDDRPADLLRRPGGVPAEDGGGDVPLGGEVPEGADLPRGGGDRDRRPRRPRLEEVPDAVVDRMAAGGDGGPERRREDRVEGLHRGGPAAAHQLPEVGERNAVGEQPVEGPEVGAVEPDDEEARRRQGLRRRVVRGEGAGEKEKGRPPGEEGGPVSRHRQDQNSILAPNWRTRGFCQAVG